MTNQLFSNIYSPSRSSHLVTSKFALAKNYHIGSTGIPRLQENPCSRVGRSAFSYFKKTERESGRSDYLSIKKTQRSDPVRFLKLRFLVNEVSLYITRS